MELQRILSTAHLTCHGWFCLSIHYHCIYSMGISTLWLISCYFIWEAQRTSRVRNDGSFGHVEHGTHCPKMGTISTTANHLQPHPWPAKCIYIYMYILYIYTLYIAVLHIYIYIHIYILYCIVLYCLVLCCVVLCCIVLYCIVLYCTVLYCIVLYCMYVCMYVCNEMQRNVM